VVHVSKPVLRVEDLHAHYGSAHVLQGVSLEVSERRCVTIFGRNGVGKTTLVHAIMGIVSPSAGRVIVDGASVAGRSIDHIARSGVGLVPQGRRVFPNLTVEENLQIAARPGTWTLSDIYGLLPQLKQRRRNSGTQLSGGEQQMLAIARAVMGNPRLLLMDEPSEGLAPLLVQEVGDLIMTMRAQGLSVLLVEQNIGLGMRVADDVLLMDHGRVSHAMTAEEFRGRPDLAHELLGVSVPDETTN
jgi:branched-chain amino acid transport system ATP-binding protein